MGSVCFYHKSNFLLIYDMRKVTKHLKRSSTAAKEAYEKKSRLQDEGNLIVSKS